MVAVRDPFGFRPLVLGKLKDSPVVASETCALDLIGAKFVREVEPGEVLLINEDGIQSFKPFPQTQHAQCIFEFIYFARPDSFIFNRNVYQVRKDLGIQLAKESPADVDMVVPIPDSGFPATIGYAFESKIPLELGMIRNHYVGRTFIEPEQSIRHFGVKIKLNPVKGLMKGKQIVTVDDSIVRATTSRKINQDVPKCRCQRGSCEDQFSPHHPSLFLRHRYTRKVGTDRLLPYGKGDSEIYHRQLSYIT